MNNETILTLAIATLAGLVFLYPLLLTRTGSRILWSPARRSRILAWVMERLLMKKLGKGRRVSYDVILRCLEACRKEEVGLEALRILGCPEGSILGEFWRMGFYLINIEALKRNCDMESELKERTQVFMLLSGFYKGYMRPREVYLYCDNNIVEALIDDKLYSSKTLDEKAAASLASIVSGSRHVEAGADLVVQYGCNGGHVNLSRTSLLLLPEAGSSLEDLVYALGLDAGEKPVLVKEAAQGLSWLLRNTIIENIKRNTIPPLLAGLLALEPRKPSCGTSAPIVTDKPRLACPQYTPFMIKDPSGEADRELIAIIEALRKRSGNPARAVLGLLVSGEKDKALALARLIVWDPRPSVDRVNYIEPWYLPYYNRYYSDKVFLEKECVRPMIDCILWRGPGPVELELMGYGIGLPWKSMETPLYYNSRESKKIIKTRIIGASEKALTYTGLLATLEETIKRLSGKPITIITPNRLLADSITKDLESCKKPGNQCHVYSWRDFELKPWRIEGSELIIVYPERIEKPLYITRILRDHGYKILLKAHLERLEDLGKLGLLISPGLALYKGHGVKLEVANPLGHEVNTETDDKKPYLDSEEILNEAQRVFREKWNWRFSLRPHQKSSIHAILKSSRAKPPSPVVSIYPTGSGKSAIFQVSGLLLSGTYGSYTLVISPLKALMRDQVDSLIRKGIPAVRVDSSQPPGLRRIALDLAVIGAVDFVYATPERFQDQAFTFKVSDVLPSLLVLDEAHTVAKWGSSFRPSYLYAARLLGDLAREAGWPPMTLFTATAGGDLLKQVLSKLGIGEYKEYNVDLLAGDPVLVDPSVEGPVVFRSPTVRSNLYFTARKYTDEEERLKQIAREIQVLASKASKVSEPWLGLVFTSFVKSDKYSWANTEELASELSKLTGLEVIAYHGQLPQGERKKREDMVYNASRTGKGPRLIVATKAFGMGMDLPNIRFVVHVLPSDSVEDYYQEAGRAGRDGLPSWIVSFYSRGDYIYKRQLIAQQRITPSLVLEAYNTVASLQKNIREKTGGWPNLIIPLSQTPSRTRMLKGLDTLRALGYIDYQVIRSGISAYIIPPAMEPSEHLPWYMPLGSRVFIGPRLSITPPGWRKSRLEIYTCREKQGVYPVAGLRFKVGDTEISTMPGEACNSWERMILQDKETMVIVYPSLEEEKALEPRSILAPEDFALVTRLSFYDLEKYDSYTNIMEKAAEIAEKKGDDDADRFLKEAIDKELSNPPRLEPLSPPPSSMGSIVYCPSLQVCIDKAVPTVIDAQEWLGSTHAVAVALQNDDITSVFQKAYRNTVGAEHPVAGTGIYRRVRRASSEGPWKLMDLGYIVLVARGDGRIKGLLERLEAYPYKTIYLYSTLNSLHNF